MEKSRVARAAVRGRTAFEAQFSTHARDARTREEKRNDPVARLAARGSLQPEHVAAVRKLRLAWSRHRARPDDPARRREVNAALTATGAADASDVEALMAVCIGGSTIKAWCGRQAARGVKCNPQRTMGSLLADLDRLVEQYRRRAKPPSP